VCVCAISSNAKPIYRLVLSLDELHYAAGRQPDDPPIGSSLLLRRRTAFYVPSNLIKRPSPDLESGDISDGSVTRPSRRTVHANVQMGQLDTWSSQANWRFGWCSAAGQAATRSGAVLSVSANKRGQLVISSYYQSKRRRNHKSSVPGCNLVKGLAPMTLNDLNSWKLYTMSWSSTPWIGWFNCQSSGTEDNRQNLFGFDEASIEGETKRVFWWKCVI
jgi:hypothetical protein